MFCEIWEFKNYIESEGTARVEDDRKGKKRWKNKFRVDYKNIRQIIWKTFGWSQLWKFIFIEEKNKMQFGLTENSPINSSHTVIFWGTSYSTEIISKFFCNPKLVCKLTLTMHMIVIHILHCRTIAANWALRTLWKILWRYKITVIEWFTIEASI